MGTEKTTYRNWDKPVLPSDNLATELGSLFDQIDLDVDSLDFDWSVSDNGASVLDLPNDINFGNGLDVSDDLDGTLTVAFSGEADNADTVDGKHANELVSKHEFFLARINTSNGVNVSGGSWQKMPYNHVETNHITGATFNTSTNELTLPAGTYELDCHQAPYGTDDVTMRLYDSANNTEIKRGTTGYSSNSGSASLTITGIITLTAETTMEIQLYPKQNSSWGAGVVRNDTVPNPSFAGSFKLEKIDEDAVVN